MIRRDGVIVWLSYFDRGLSRSEGRRVPINKAIKSPTKEQLLKAAERLGWKAEPLELSHPSYWRKKSSAIRVYPNKRVKKEILLRLLADEVVKLK
ncbi:MAG: signal recognition particle subunit SRP19/SEC65 family protein [Nitrososphaerota archaeon]